MSPTQPRASRTFPTHVVRSRTPSRAFPHPRTRTPQPLAPELSVPLTSLRYGGSSQRQRADTPPADRSASPRQSQGRHHPPHDSTGPRSPAQQNAPVAKTTGASLISN
ncbi:hypothetical protein Lesp02_36380 [Lentzea sp. NBRC 105346]|nr:hypothetical protein Lesp02_36380 [Lentzea sp. NBRC 105346]